ncbi:MAG: hypothetical protein U1C55_08400 [Smithellaceae bacterium]|nr:hypothetical protein [Smithellaceae bacterium]
MKRNAASGLLRNLTIGTLYFVMYFFFGGTRWGRVRSNIATGKAFAATTERGPPKFKGKLLADVGPPQTAWVAFYEVVKGVIKAIVHFVLL